MESAPGPTRVLAFIRSRRLTIPANCKLPLDIFATVRAGPRITAFFRPRAEKFMKDFHCLLRLRLVDPNRRQRFRRWRQLTEGRAEDFTQYPRTDPAINQKGSQQVGFHAITTRVQLDRTGQTKVERHRIIEVEREPALRATSCGQTVERVVARLAKTLRFNHELISATLLAPLSSCS